MNIDMIGRTDAEHPDDPRYVYLIGSDKLSSELHAISEEANATFTNLALDYTFNAPDDPNDSTTAATITTSPRTTFL